MEKGRLPMGVAADSDSSIESFSFALPVAPSQVQHSDFEFGSSTLKIPINDPNKDTPADVLFHNGRLLPHAYQCPSQKESGSDLSQLSSRTSSTKSKDSAGTSSRSSSNNSSSSRSSSYNGTRKGSVPYMDKKTSNPDIVATRTAIRRVKNEHFELHPSNRPRRPVSPSASKAKLSFRQSNTKAAFAPQESNMNKQVKQSSENSWFGLKIFESFTSACRECHALEPSVEQGAIRENVKSK